MPAVVVLSFDPYIQVLGLAVPLRAIGLAAAICVALLVAAAFARGFPQLRRDDLLYLAVGVVPGAIVGGRLVHALAYLDSYARDPAAIFDPARGSLSLLGAVIGGTASAAAVAAMIGAPVRAWMGAAAVPLLLAIGLGKLAQLSGGGGQGAPLEAPWAVAFGGRGPWLASGASVPSHPSQLYESLWVLLPVAAILALGTAREWRWRRPAWLFTLVLMWWLVGRVLIGFTWRDDRGIGPFNAEQGLALTTLGVLFLSVARAGREAERRVVLEPPIPALVEEPPRVQPERRRGRGKRRRNRERRVAARNTNIVG